MRVLSWGRSTCHIQLYALALAQGMIQVHMHTPSTQFTCSIHYCQCLVSLMSQCTCTSTSSTHYCRHTASSMSLRSLLRSSRAVSQSCMRIEQESFPHIALITFLWSEGAWEGEKREKGREEGREGGRGREERGKEGENEERRENGGKAENLVIRYARRSSLTHTPALCRSIGTLMRQSSCHTRT